MSLTRKVAYNTGALIAGRALNTAISLVIVAILTRYLGVAGFGAYTTIFAFVGLFTTFADFGFMLVLLKELGAGKVAPEKAAANVLTIRSIFALVVYAICFSIGWFFHYPLAVHLGIGIIALSMLWGSIQGTVIAVLQANLKAHLAVIGDVIGRVTILLLIIWFSRISGSLVLILLAYPIGAFVDFAFNAYFANRCVRLRLGFDLVYWKYLWSQSWPIGLAGILAIIYFKVDSVMLSLMKTPTDIGIYGAPYKIFEVVLALSTLYMGVAFPILTRYLAHKDMHHFNGAMQKSFNFMIILSLPIMTACLAVAAPIIRVVAGEEFVVAHTFLLGGIAMTTPIVLGVLSLTIPLSYLTNIFNNMIIGCGHQRALIIPNLLFLLFNIILNLVMIPYLSYIGSAIATILTEIIVLSVNWYLLSRFVKLKLYYAVIAKVLLASLGMFFVMYLTRHQIIVIPLVLGIVVYGIMILTTKAVTKQEVMEIIKGRVE